MPAPRPSTDPIFIVGCPRSGTSLLRDLLRSHPRLTFAPETHFIPRFYRAYGDPANDAEAMELARRILRLAWMTPWTNGISPASFAGDRSFAAVLSRIYETWMFREGKVRWGDKTPHYVLNIPVLLEIFPRARVLHIIRDGRDVAVSWLRVKFEPRNVFAAARLWKQMVIAGRDAAAQLPPDTILEVRYETLITQPDSTMRDVCAFLGEEFTSEVLRPTRIPRQLRPDRWRLHRKGSQKAEIIPGNSGQWRSKLSRGDRVIFESVAGDRLASLGYELEGIGRKIGGIEELYWRAHHQMLWTADRMAIGHRMGQWIRTAWDVRRAERLGH